jgi:HEAT repeat protein
MAISCFWRGALLIVIVLSASCADQHDATRFALSNSDPEVRRDAIRMLTGDASAAKVFLPELAAALQDEAPSVRVAAALAIQQLEPQNTAYQPILESALRGGQGPVFLEVGRTGIDGKWAIPTLLSLLRDRRPPIRALSAQALGQIAPEDERVRPALERGLRDENAAVRKACQQAIDRANGSRALAPS